jgi:hypothetical protein
VPRVCSFDGISIWLHYQDHQPPHFHAKYGANEGAREVLLEIPTLAIYDGSLPRPQFAAVRAWAAQHLHELQQNWDLARANQALIQIAPP